MDIARRLKQKIKKKTDEKDVSESDETERKTFKKSFSKKKKKTGLPVEFEDRRSQIDAQVRFKPKVAEDFIIVNPQSKTCQNTQELNEDDTQTPVLSFRHDGMNHLEGGWPREMDLNEASQVNRFLKKIEKDEFFIESVLSLSLSTERKVRQNNAIDIYSQYFEYEDDRTVQREDSMKSVAVYQDPEKSHGGEVSRPVSMISWADGSVTEEQIAISYASPEFLGNLDIKCQDGFIFNVTNPTKHSHRLVSSSCITSLQFNPKDGFQVAGGCHAGSVCWWDARSPEVVTAAERHDDPVYGVIWINSKTNSELMTSSTDGTVKFWDIRMFSKSKETFIVDVDNKDRKSNGDIQRAKPVSYLEYDSTIPSKFMLGCDSGELFICSRKAQAHCDVVTAKFAGHHGPVRYIERNPAFSKYFLSIGDWSFRIWSDDVYGSPVMWTYTGTDLVTHGTWIPTRPSVTLTSAYNGRVEAWV